MPLLRIQSYPGVKQVLIAGEGIADLATVELFQGERQVKMGATGDDHLAAGVARGAAVSGELVRVVTQGIVSGVKIGSGYTVDLGDRLTLAVSGKVMPLNTITATISGEVASGLWSGLASGLQPILSGITTFNTGRVLGKALVSGGSGAAIQMLVSL